MEDRMIITRAFAIGSLAGILMGLAAPSAQSQRKLYTFVGDQDHDALGATVAGPGDIDGDGYDDVYAAAPRTPDIYCLGPGYVRIYSGRDGSTLLDVTAGGPCDMIGFYAGGTLGDMDHDGVPDFFVTSVPAQSAWAFSGRDGSILHAFANPAIGFGQAASAAGDVNADGYADLLVGAKDNANLRGTAFVYSGKDGTLLYQLDGDGSSLWFGESVSKAGAVDRDGYDDFIVGANWVTGYVRVYSGKNAAVLYDFPAPNGYGDGLNVSDAGDVDQD